MIKYIIGEGFFTNSDLHNLQEVVDEFEYSDKGYCKESAPLIVTHQTKQNLIEVIGEQYTMKVSSSGKMRKPDNCLIHFEDYNSIFEWSCIVAISPTTFNFLKHKSGATSALDSADLNFKYFPDWDYYTNLILKPNDVVFYRPWLFHSLESGTVQYFKFT